jgi:hypothetical protein
VAPDQTYQWFCENFMDCVIPSNEWKLRARKKMMSEYVSTTLEAFAVLVYKNAYVKWNEEFRSTEDDETEASSLTSASRTSEKHRFLYTSDSKGSRKYEGWNPEGMKFYNEVLDLIGNQRKLPGCTFEQKLLRKLAAKPRRGTGHGDESEAPRVNNNVDLLLEMIGL